MFFGWEGPEREWGGGGRLFEFEFEGVGGGVGWALIRGWALIQFFCLRDGRLFEVGANSRLGAYSNKYGITKIENLQARKSSKNSSKLNVIIIKWLNFVIDRVARNPTRS